MKVLHAPTPTGGMAWGLAQGEMRLGIEPTVLIKSNNWLDYPYHISLGWETRSKIGILLSSLRAFSVYRNKFDVFHFNFGSTLIDFHTYHIFHWDLPFYPKRSKIILTYNGCDARQKYATMRRVPIAACHSNDCYGGMCNNGAFDAIRKKSVNIASTYANHVFAVNPDLLYFLPENKSSFLPYATAQWYHIETLPYKIGKKIRIVHSPTNRAVKGSDYILKALDNLAGKYPIEVILVENIPNSQAMHLYSEADLVIDQVLVGWYGGFAVEVMKMGKPVAAYIRECDLELVPANMAREVREAIINVNPETIERTIQEYLENPTLLYQKSQAAIDYVNKWHDPVYVAGITKAVYES